MNEAKARRGLFRGKAAPAVVGLACAVFVVLSFAIGLHPDDVGVLKSASTSSWSEVWASSFMHHFYRPLMVSVVKLFGGVFGHSALPLRIFQGGLLFATLLLFAYAVRRVESDVARAIGLLCVLASPMTFVAITPFALGFADTLVALAFLGCVCLLENHESRSRLTLTCIALAVFAMLFKESGVLVAAYVSIVLFRQRQHRLLVLLVSLVGAYLTMRNSVVTHGQFVFATGWGTQMLDAAALRLRFGDSPYLLQAYNVVSNFTTALTYVPERGQFRFSAGIGLASVVLTSTSFICVRYLRKQGQWQAALPLVAIVVLNAGLGFSYVRSRVMFVAYFAIAIVFTKAVDDLWRHEQHVLGIRSRRFAIGLGLGWIVLFVHALIRLRIQASH